MSELIKYSATDTALGYLYQFEMALNLLLDRPGTQVSIETLDDVVFEDNGNTHEIIQLKHHINIKKSISNSSVDLWKTLNIWIDGMKELEGNDLSRIMMTTEISSKNSIAHSLNPDENQRDISRAIKLLDNVSSTSKNKSNKKSYAKFQKLDPLQKQTLVESIEILDKSPTITQTRKLVINKIRILSRPEKLKPFFERVWGLWVNLLSDRLYTKSKEPISYDEVNAQIQNIRDEFTQDNLPIDFLEREPDLTQISGYRDSIFVKQLDWIGANDSVIQYAIIEYWKAYNQRVRWVKDELLFDQDLIQYEKRLFDAWRKEFAKMERRLDSNKSPTRQSDEGWTLYEILDKTPICIRNRCTEPYVSQGSFHMLADQMRMGWHPDFKNRLKTLLKTASGGRK